MAEVKDTIFEEREEELMISGDSSQTLRKAHFLRPTIDKSVKTLPQPPLLLSFNTSPDNLFPQMRYCAWRLQHLEWNKWVETMQVHHHHTWKKCGIYEAVMCSKIKICKHIDLLFGVAEKWCCETNTFVFPWGEATVTLEDMLVLGGFSVSGYSVLDPLENAEMKNTEATLIQCYDEIKLKTGHYPKPNQWIKHFVSKHGTKVEHEAFLCLWLSKYVFPKSKNVKNDLIDKTVFPVAIRLARGIRIALAQPVLARIYQDLGTLKDRIVHSKKDELKLCAQLHLVQVWVWERFPSLSPKPLLIKNDEPRLAKWHDLRKMGIGNVRLALDSEDQHFKWRPYVAKMGSYFTNLYRENEGWFVNAVDSATDSEVESILRCMKVSKLVGIDCIEQQYLPHRVAMQFGLDQDVPQYDLSRFSIRSSKDGKVFIPSKFFKANVTNRYFDWWRSSKSVQLYGALEIPVQERRRTLSKCSSCANVAAVNDDDDDEQLTLNQSVRSLNADKIHVGTSLDGALHIPSPCKMRDLMEIEENRVDELQAEASETVKMELEEVAAVEEHQTKDSCNTRMESFELEDSDAFIIFMKSGHELDARTTRLERIIAAQKLKSKRKLEEQGEKASVMDDLIVLV